MVLKKFIKKRPHDEKYNLPVVCGNYDRAKRDYRNGGPDSAVSSHSSRITSPRLAEIGEEEEEV